MTAPIDVLLVDDDRSVRTLAAESLAAETDQFRITDTSSPTEALELLAIEAYDCIVSDQEMPEMTGIELLNAVRDEHGGLPFVLFTGRGSEEIASDAISAGVTDYLRKQSGQEQYTILANRISNAVEQHRTRRQLERSHRRLSLFFDQSPLGVIEWDDEFRCRQ